MAHRGQLGLLLLLGLALFVAAGAERQLEAREGVFVGYKENDGSLTAEAEGAAGAEADVAAAADDSAAAAAGADGGDAAAAGNDAAAAEGDAAAGAAGTGDAAAAGADAEALAQKAGVVGRTVLLHTQFGPIRVKLLEELAPRTTALVWRLAEARGCRNCAFYRNEARPKMGTGPPYALLQGRMPDLPEVPPLEGNVEVKMGHVCFIPETRDFFIAYGDHPEWGTAHTVWGRVDEWFATDFIISQQWTSTTHPEFGTVMRMLKQEVPVKIAAEGDRTYSGLLGPMH